MFGFHPSDATLVQRTMEGHPEAFETLVFRYQRQAHAIARALGLKPPDVDDTVQEAFLQAFRDLPDLRAHDRFGGWFLNIVRHVAIKELRHSSRGHAAGAALQDPSPAAPPARPAADELEQQDFREHLWRQVAELPQGTREAIFLYHYEGESVRQVARALGLSIPGAKRRLRSGREQLREKLWRGLAETLRETLPSARQWRASGRRLGLLVLTAIPASWTARAGAELVPGGGDAIAQLAQRSTALARRMRRPALLTAAKNAVAIAALACLFLFLGRYLPEREGHGRTAPTSESRVVTDHPAGAATADEGAARDAGKLAAAVAPPRVDAAPPAAPEADDGSPGDARDRGTVIVRVIWGDTRLPAAGVRGQVIPWGSPDLYIDERTFTSGPDGTVQVDHLFKGGASVLLDRGGSSDVRVVPGEEREVVVEVPPGFDVQGLVVDSAGVPIGGATIWISFSGVMNWGSDVATSGPDGSFFVRSISSSQYIAARATGRATSDLRPLKGEAGSTIEVRLVLGGAARWLRGTVLDEAGKPLPHAKVMVGVEYPIYALLDDGSTGFSAPPYFGFTDEAGRFDAGSIAPGKTRVAVRAPGFVPLEEQVDVTRGLPLDVELTLQRGATLSGKVSGPGGEPLHGAHVVIGDMRDFLSIKVFTGDGGAYRLSGLPAGELAAYAEHRSGGKASTRLTVAGEESLRWDPVLSRDLELRGRVLDERGVPREGFVLVIEQSLGGGARRATQKTARADAEGRFTFGELSDLAYRIKLHEPDSPYPCALVEDLRPGPDDVELRVEPSSLASAHLLGRVLDADGNGFPGAKVICSSVLGGYRVYFTGKDGAYRAGPLPRGRYTLEIQTLARESLAIGEQELREGEERDLGVHYLEAPLR